MQSSSMTTGLTILHKKVRLKSSRKKKKVLWWMIIIFKVMKIIKTKHKTLFNIKSVENLNLNKGLFLDEDLFQKAVPELYICSIQSWRRAPWKRRNQRCFVPSWMLILNQRKITQRKRGIVLSLEGLKITVNSYMLLQLKNLVPLL